MEYQGFQQMVKTPTRITENSSSLIDHHYCSHPEHVLSITSPAFGLSDHNLLFWLANKMQFEIYQESTLYCHILLFKEIEC